MTSPHLKAVIFDIGGVVVRSPFIAIATYEHEHGIPENYLNCSIVGRGSQGAWQKFERGEIPLFVFYDAFSRDLSDTTNGNIWYKEYCQRKSLECPQLPNTLNVDGRELFGAMMRESKMYDPHVLQAIHRIREAGRHKLIALTNNFAKSATMEPIPQSELEFLGWENGGATPDHLRVLFDDYCDSSTLGIRKPEPAFYQLACARNDVRPDEVIFLDDIRMNLKTARDMGMETIHVEIGRTLEASQRLEAKLGINLTGPYGSPYTAAKL
ncbi:epoxide hydrolase [Infundibulicybe gibba]|nr:epoxide hydrolase [Infundibulicybe gibba]